MCARRRGGRRFGAQERGGGLKRRDDRWFRRRDRQPFQLAEEIQRSILENLYFVPIFRHAGVNAIGPRIAAQKWQDVFPTITTAYAFPWEDLKLKE